VRRAPEPFEDVQYYAPYKSDGVSLNTLRSNEALLENVTALTWGLREVLQYAEVLLNKDDIDAKADALIDFIKENVLDKRFVDPMLERPHTVTSFADLDAWFKDVLRALEKKDDQSWRTHHVATIRKVRNRLSNISLRCKGLVADDGATSDLPFGSFQDRTVYVIDVAGLEEDAQDLIFARVVTKLREHLEKRDLGVQHVVVFVDELNKYAPGDGPETYVRKMLLDIAERGRYWAWCSSPPQQFARRCTAAWWATRAQHLRPNGRRRAGHTRLRRPEPGDQDEACHAGERTADGASPALHTTDLRTLSRVPSVMRWPRTA
jgi:hypothetical protein